MNEKLRLVNQKSAQHEAVRKKYKPRIATTQFMTSALRITTYNNIIPHVLGLVFFQIQKTWFLYIVNGNISNNYSKRYAFSIQLS